MLPDPSRKITCTFGTYGVPPPPPPFQNPESITEQI